MLVGMLRQQKSCQNSYIRFGPDGYCRNMTDPDNRRPAALKSAAGRFLLGKSIVSTAVLMRPLGRYEACSKESGKNKKAQRPFGTEGDKRPKTFAH